MFLGHEFLIATNARMSLCREYAVGRELVEASALVAGAAEEAVVFVSSGAVF